MFGCMEEGNELEVKPEDELLGIKEEDLEDNGETLQPFVQVNVEGVKEELLSEEEEENQAQLGEGMITIKEEPPDSPAEASFVSGASEDVQLCVKEEVPDEIGETAQPFVHVNIEDVQEAALNEDGKEDQVDSSSGKAVHSEDPLLVPQKSKPSKVNETSKIKKSRLQYSPTKVSNALKAAANSALSITEISRVYGVPRTTLHNKLTGKSPLTSTHPGPKSFLGDDVENMLKEYILGLARWGFPLNQEAVLDSVKKVVEELNLSVPFVNRRPGRQWFQKFLKRHPEISQNYPEHLRKVKSCVSESAIRAWFQKIKQKLIEDGLGLEVLEDPTRIYNCDKTAVFLSPKGRIILGPKEQPVLEVSANSDKEAVTVLLTVNARGEIAPPLAIFPYERICKAVIKNAPPTWQVGKSVKGWMTSDRFFEYIANVFLPFLERRGAKFPVILFMDSHNSHISKHLSDLCREKGLILIALPRNSTYIMQPLDVAVFRPIKTSWSATCKQWRTDNDGKEISRITFCKAFNMAMEKLDLRKAIQTGFKTTGLFPFTPDEIDYPKNLLVGTVLDTTPSPPLKRGQISYLDQLESKLDPMVLLEFKKNRDEEWGGEESNKGLFEIWKAFVADENLLREVPATDLLETDPAEEGLDIQGEKEEHIQECEGFHVISSVALQHPTNNELPETLDAEASRHQPGSSGSRSNAEYFEEGLGRPGMPRKKSQAWKLYQEKKEINGKLVESKRKRRRVKTFEKEKKPHEAKNKKRNRVENSLSDGDDNESGMENVGAVKPDNFVVVSYNGKTYPGKVLEVNRGQVKVSHMTCSGEKAWRWPTIPDVLWYSEDEILRVIPPPKPINKRGMFSIPQVINNYIFS